MSTVARVEVYRYVSSVISLQTAPSASVSKRQALYCWVPFIFHLLAPVAQCEVCPWFRTFTMQNSCSRRKLPPGRLTMLVENLVSTFDYTHFKPSQAQTVAEYCSRMKVFLELKNNSAM